MAKVKPYQVDSDEWDDDEELVPARRKKKKSKKNKPQKKKKKSNPLRGMFSFIFVVLIGCLIWQAPALISQTGLHHKITAAFLSDCPGSVRTESVELDWKKPIVIKKIKYENQEGQPLLNIEEIRSERNLIDFVIDFWHPGSFTVSKPVVIVQADEEKTNWDYTLKKWSEEGNEKSNNSDWQFPVSINIQDGSVELRDGNDSKILVSDIQASMIVPEEADENATFEWDSQVGRNGRLLATLDANSNISDEGSLELQLKEIELEPFREILNSLVNNREFSGIMSGDIHVNWNSVDELLETVVKTDLQMENIILDLPDYLEDQIQLSEVTLTGLTHIKDSQLTIDQFNLNSEPLQINSSGKITFSDLKNLQSKAQLFQLAGNSEYSVETNLDIAKITRLLPRTVKLHENVDVQSGSIHCSVENDGQDLLVKITSSELVAERNSKTIRWEDPIQIDINAHAEEKHLVVDRVNCDSDFLKIQSTKEGKNLSVNLQCDLQQLANRLESVVDFSEAQLQGTLNGDIDYQMLSENRYQVAGELKVEDFEMQWNNQTPWIEENLTCHFEGSGQFTKSIDQMIESGQLSIVSGEDRLKIHTVNDSSEGGSPLYNMVVKGDMARWKNRMSVLDILNEYQLNDWDVNGTVDGKVKLQMNENEIVFTEGYAYFEPLKVQGPSVNIQQKRAKIQTEGTWLFNEKRFITPRSKWNSDSLALSFIDFDAKFIEGQIPQMDGELTFKGSFPKLLSWVQGPDSVSEFRYRGIVSSQLNFSNSNSTTRMNGELNLNRFVAWSGESGWNPQTQSRSVAWKPVWKEKRISLKTDVMYDEISDQVTIHQCALSSAAVLASISGTVDHLMTSRVASLDGNFDYDFPKLLAHLDPSISKNIQIVGKRQSSFSIAGPMNSRHRMATSPRRSSSSIIKPTFKTVSQTNQDWPDQFVMRAGMGWQSAEIYGLDVGAGDVNATLHNQLIDFGQVKLDVNQGHVILHPKIDFQQSPSVLSIGTGRVIQGVKITREVCQSWMKFVTPVLADSAEVDGIFSLDLQHANMPLGQLKNSDVQGTLLIHEAQAAQGPMAGKMVAIVGQLMTIFNRKKSRTLNEFGETSIRFPKQQVPFMMKNGRVVHRNLTMIVNDVRITTSGTVNADQSISLIAEIPVSQDWVDNNKYLKSMGGKTLKIPIGGTLALPQVDQRVFSMISQQAIQGSAKGLIDNQIQKQMNNLFDKIR
jgi:translocation and assembly module TamB